MTEEKPLDEYEVMGDGLNIGLLPAYEITSNERNLMLISMSIIVLSVLRSTFSGFFPHVTGFTLGQNQVISVIVIGASAYAFYFMLGYYRYYNLNTIIQVLWITFIAHIMTDVINLMGTFNISLPISVNGLLGLVYTISLVVLIIKVLRLESHKYTAIKHLKYSAIASIFSLISTTIMGTVLFYFFIPEYEKYYGLVYIATILSYYFTIKFTLALKIKEDEHYI